MAFSHTLNRFRTLTANALWNSNSSFVVKPSWRQLHGQSSTRNRSEWASNFIRMLRVALRGSSGQSFSQHLAVFCSLLARQCNVYAAQRLRRMERMVSLYRLLYSERSLQSLTLGFARRHLKGRRRNLYVLFGGACFAWDQERVGDRQIDSCLEDVDLIRRLHVDRNADCPELSAWEKVMTKAELMVWRRKLDATYLYEYKVFGTFTDCTAKSYLKVQLDLDYRRSWDKHVIETDIIDQDQESGAEVVYWATQFPFPMQSRDYVYVRRAKIFHRHRAMVLVSQATTHPRRPESRRHVRVTRFSSRMVIKPFSSFDENGFDYILTYHDDPKAPFPTTAVSWLASTGVPDYVEKMHLAAIDLDSMPATNFREMPSEEQYTSTNSSNYI